MKLWIHVGSGNIERGNPLCHKSCPIALAINDAALFGFSDADVNATAGTLKYDGLDWEFQLPAKAQDFIDDFDAGKAVAPISFEVDLTLVRDEDEVDDPEWTGKENAE